MRVATILVPLMLAAAPALAEPLKVAKGMWSSSTDIYFDVTVDGEPMEVPPDHSVVKECWSTDEEVTIDEGMISWFEGCKATGLRSEAHAFGMDLACEFDGVPMTGTAEFVVNKDQDGFAGRLLLTGYLEGARLLADGVLLGHRTGACAGQN